MSRGRLFTLSLALTLVAALPALAAAPRAVVDKPVVDVGAVRKGEPVRHTFVVRNAGDAPLELTEVKPSCGCTVAEFDARIPPGASGKLQAVVETKSFGGAIAKSVTVFTNDPKNPRLNLVIKALVREPVVARPGYARFVTVRGQAADPSVQRLTSADRPGFQVLGVQSPWPFLAATSRRAADGKGWEIELRLDREPPVGPLADYVRVRTDHPEMPLVDIAVSGLVRPVIAVAPRVADFGRRQLDEPQSKSLEVRNLGEAAVELTAAETDLAGLEARIEPVEEGRHYRIQLTLSPGLPKGDFAGQLTIFTNSARQPKVEVPLRGTIL